MYHGYHKLSISIIYMAVIEKTLLNFNSQEVSAVSDVAERTNDSLPFEITYAVQKLGMHSDILVAVLLPLSFLKSDK